jgi:hypothetical protein
MWKICAIGALLSTDHNRFDETIWDPAMAKKCSCYIPPQVFCSAELTSFLARFNRNVRLRLLDKANALSGIRIVSDGMSWMPMSWMQINWTQVTLLAIAYCVLLKHCIDSKCVHELMWCFRSAQCCVVRVHCSQSVASDPMVFHGWLPHCDMK